MKLSIRRNLLFVTILVCSVASNSAISADYDKTYQGAWRTTADIVTGWDWSLPPDTTAAEYSGIFNDNTAVPPDFRGQHLKRVKASWKDLEPSEGTYDFTLITNALADKNYDGVVLDVRGMVVAVEDSSGNPALPWEITAPPWLNSAPTTQEGLKNGYRIKNLNIYDPVVKSKLIALINKIAQTGISSNPRLKGQIIHGVSNSRGEEFNGAQASKPEAVAAMQEIIRAWTAAYGTNSRKLAWLKEKPVVLYDTAVSQGGTGIRGGIIEKWLRHQYTPGGALQTGQVLSNDGYLDVDESFGPIAGKRFFMDENEEYSTANASHEVKFGSVSHWPFRYRMAMLRSLQMRRNVLWTERNSTMNPKLLNWVSLELGQNVTTSRDAWVMLGRSWTRTSGSTREVKNFERWLYQRDSNDVQTSATLAVNHGFNASDNGFLPEEYWKTDIARTGLSLGIAVDDRFLFGGPHSVAVKVTYFDSEAGGWSFVYTTPNGNTVKRRVNGTATNAVKTATFFLDDFSAPMSNFNFDVSLESDSGKTPFMFVRLIKLENEASNRPMSPGNLTAAE